MITGKTTDWTGSYHEVVYQFRSTGAATSYYRENYAFNAPCKDVSPTSCGKTSSLAVHSLTTGHVEGGPAFFEQLKTGHTDFPDGVNADEWVVVGRYVCSVDALYPVGQPRLTPNAATQALCLA